MREYKLDQRSLYPDLPEPLLFDYAVLVEEVPAGSFFCESYGAKVTSRVSGESAAIRDITLCVSRIDELMELLARNQVSPTHLRDVVDDWL